MRLFHFLKIIIINFFIFLTFVLIIEIIFGSWLKNNFSYRLSSERNIYRVYKFSFLNYEGESVYKRDSNGFRFNEKYIVPKNVDVIFSGGSTTNQKFLNFKDTIVGNLDKNFDEVKIINAGIDGLSIKGHINSFNYWFNKIDNLSPKFYIFYIGVNDRHLLKEIDKPIDELQESNFKGNLREFLESNSFFYKQFRYLKAVMYLKFNLERGVNIVNQKSVVYAERANKKFLQYKIFEEKNLLNKNFSQKYSELLSLLTKKVLENNAKPIYITQNSGYGISQELYSAAETVMKHCADFNLSCINLAKDLDLNYEDFYDELHLNPKGSKKVSDFLTKR